MSGGSRDGAALNLVLPSPLTQPCIRLARYRFSARRRQNISTPKKANEKGEGREETPNNDNIALHLIKSFSGRVFEEQDPANGCRNYPNLEYLSYEECDDQFLRKLLPGLTPVWMTEDFDQVSTQVFDENGTFGELLLTFFLNRYFHASISRCLV